MSFKGIIPAVTTPFDESLAVSTDGLAANVEQLIAAGVHGIVGTGTMGESGSLTREERKLVLSTIVDVAAGRVPVIAGVAAQTAAVAAGYIEDAKEAGVDGVMVLPPLLYEGGFAELVAFFSSVAAVAELPVIAYNNPKAAGYDLSAKTLIGLSEAVEGVVQVKECSGDARRIPAILKGSDGRLAVLVGGDDWALEGLCAGAGGWISGVADPLPTECVELHDLIARRDLDAAQELYGRLLPMARFDMTPKLVQYYKAALDLVGQVGGPSRPPRGPLTDAELEEVQSALELVRAESPVSGS
jgi:1-pyrroline-4-hydroxy-2-carboxylate deaminase